MREKKRIGTARGMVVAICPTPENTRSTIRMDAQVPASLGVLATPWSPLASHALAPRVC